MKKKISLITGLSILLFLVSCKQESVKLTSDDPVEQIVQLAEGVEQFGNEWTDEQWEDAVDKLEKAVENMSNSEDDYNDNDELREATSKIIQAEKPFGMKLRIMKIFTKKATDSAKDDSDDFGDDESDDFDDNE